LKLLGYLLLLLKTPALLYYSVTGCLTKRVPYSFLLSGIPAPGSVGMSEVKEGSSYGREVLDKTTVEINEAYEGLYISLVLQGRPIMNSGNFHGVHCNFVLQNDQFKVLDLPPVELTFLQAEK